MSVRLCKLTSVLAMMVIAACSQDQSPVTESEARAGAIASESAACKMFTASEISAALGADVNPGTTSGPLGSACSWSIRGEDRSVMVQIVPRDYWEDGTAQSGGEALTDIGEKAFVGHWLDDHRAGALTTNGAVYVMSPNKETSIALLRAAAPRVPPQ